MFGGLSPQKLSVATGLRGQRELSTGLQLQQKHQNHTAISHCCLTRSQVGQKAPSFLQFWAANIQIQRLRKNCYDRVKPIIQSTKLQIASFAKVSALEL